MKHDCHQLTAEFLDIVYAKMFIPLISRPSRITSYTATLLNFINNLDRYCRSGLLFTDTSDHFPVFSIRSVEHNYSEKETWISYREESNMEI